MPKEDSYAEFASIYDRLIEQFQSFDDAVVFGLMYDHVSPGERVLDIGIGTGLSSERLARHGLHVYGVDLSEAMLAECAKKGFAKDLRRVDVGSEILPYHDRSFHHVLSSGVLHFFEDLKHIFHQSSRVLKPGGTFTFTIMTDRDGGPEDDTVIRRMTRWSMEVFYHGKKYINCLGKRYGFKPVSWLLMMGDIDPEDGRKNYYWVYVMKRIEGKE